MQLSAQGTSSDVEATRRDTTGSQVFLQFSDPVFEAGVVNRGSYKSIPHHTERVDSDGDGVTNVYLVTDTTDTGFDETPVVKEEVPKQHSIVTIFTIWNTMMGTSILAMPWALSQAGFGFGIFLILFVAGIACYTGYLAFQTTEDLKIIKNIPASVYMDISEACAYHWGKVGRIIALIFSQVSLIGASIVYYVLLSNFLYYTGDYIFHSTSNQTTAPQIIEINGRNFTDVICAAGNYTRPVVTNEWYNKLWVLDRTVPAWLLLVIFPLVSIKSPTFLGKFTTLATVSVAYLITLIIIKGSSWGINMRPENQVFNFSKFFPSLTGTCSLAMYIHNAIQTILRAQRNPENNARDIVIAFSFTTLTYSTIGISFFIIFPLTKNCIADNLLNNLVTDVPVFVGRLFLFLQMSAIYPMLVYILRAQLMNAIFKKVYPSWRHVLVVHIIVLGLGVLFATVYPSIGTIIRFIGALCGFVYIFTIPPMITLLNKRILGMVPSPTLSIQGDLSENGRSLLKFESQPTTQWRDHRTKILWWIRCAFYILIVLLGLMNFIAQFVLLGLKK